MNIKFCGAAREVTGSAHLITLEDGYRILLDCGLNQGKGREVWDFNNRWLFEPSSVDAVILSHSHIDHTGRIPQLVKDGFKGPIHSTHATRSLCSIMLLDSAKIQEKDVEWYNKKLLQSKDKKKKTPRRPLYTSKDVEPTLSRFVGHGYGRWFKISQNVEVKFQDAGHILGSASVQLRFKEGKNWVNVGFTGDIGRPDRPILRDPVPMEDMDYIITESTYGNRDHESAPEQSEAFLKVIKETCVEKKGKLLIPAFSVGRTQEIVYMLDKMETAGLLPKIPVFVDSPLAVNATTIFGVHPECYDDALNEYLLIDDNPFGFNSLTYIRDVADSKALNARTEPAIIISSSGMMNAGRVKHHLANSIGDKKNTILIVGYCAPYTPGGILRSGASHLSVFGKKYEVKADVKIMDSFSAHADRTEMKAFLLNQKKSAKKMFLVHGEYGAQQAFKTYLEEDGFNHIHIPENGQEFQL